jgi:curli biogenesis system outer membrane secretion channel CsgG
MIAWCVGCQTIPIEEKSAPTEKKKIPTIAVWDMENLNQTESAAFDLGELLSNKVIEALVESGKWNVVEREQLIAALEELNLSSTSMVADSTRLRIGKIVGAHYMVFGHYMQMMQVMQLNLRLVDVETGRVIKSAERSTFDKDIGKWLELVKAAANDLQT